MAQSALIVVVLLPFGIPSVTAPEDLSIPVACADAGGCEQEAPTLAPQIPARLKIPALGVDAQVVPVGLLPDGKPDVPGDGKVLGWYNLGARPGEQGNAVIDGHLDTTMGPGAFFTLHQLRPGDTLLVTDEAGAERTFHVRESVVYDAEDAPLRRIFGSASGTYLNLITCAGQWRREIGHYDQRLVVYAEAASEQ